MKKSIAFVAIALLTLILGKFAYDFVSTFSMEGDNAIFQPKVHRVMDTTLATERPFVGKEGRDLYGYPLKTADKVALLRLLRARKFTELNTYLTQYHDDFDSDFRNEYWAYDSADAFNVVDPAVGTLIELWVETTPDHFAPYLARARHFAAKAWYARARNELPFLQSLTLQSHFDRASADARLALEKRPRLVSAWRTLIKARMAAGDRAGLLAVYEEAETSCPQCWSFRFVRLLSLQPRWSGKKQGFIAFARKTASQKAINPRFAAAEAMIPWLLSLDAGSASAEKKLTVGLTRAENFYLREQRARVRNQLKRFEGALLDTEIGLKSRPQNIFLLKTRVNTFTQLRRVEESAPILLTLARLEPVDPWVHSMIRWTSKELLFQMKKEADKENYAKTAVLCGLAQDLQGEGKPASNCIEHLYKKAEAQSVLRALVTQNPDDFVARRHLDYALFAAQKTADILPVWDDYLTRHPDDPRALFERAGTLQRLGRAKEARKGAHRACEFGLAKACAVLKKR